MVINQRLDWVDIFRGIGILLVVIGHSGIPNWLSWWIWSFHMPLFFMISGFLFNPIKNTVFLVFLRKRTKTLLLPYISFTIIAIIAMLFLRAKIDVEVDSVEGLKRLLFMGWHGLALWFLPVLYITELLYSFLNIYVKSPAIRRVVLLSFSFIGYIFCLYEIHFAYKLEVVFTAIVFYGVGVFLRGMLGYFFKLKLIPSILIGIFFLLVNVLLCFSNTQKLDMCFNQLGNPILSYGAAFSGIGFVFILSLNLQRIGGWGRYFKKTLLFLGINTLIVLGVHQIIKLGLNYGYLYFPNNLYIKLTKHIVFWIFQFIVIMFFNRYLYGLLGKPKPCNIKR